MQHIRKVISATIILGTILFIWQCGDESGLNLIGHSTIPRVAHAPLNPDNPCDSFGIVHNARCEYLLSRVTDSDSTLELKWMKIASGIEYLGDSLGWDESVVNAIIEGTELFVAGLDSLHDPITALQNISANANVTSLEATYIRAIGGAFANATDSTSFMNNLIQIETEILSENWGPDEDLAMRNISGAKHSFVMWMWCIDDFGWDYGMEWGLYTAAHDMDAYNQGISSGVSKIEAEGMMECVSALAASGWHPGVKFPGYFQ